MKKAVSARQLRRLVRQLSLCDDVRLDARGRWLADAHRRAADHAAYLLSSGTTNPLVETACASTHVPLFVRMTRVPMARPSFMP